jgi:TRAP-type C4-dicarboxylate transport system permease small subunit
MKSAYRSAMEALYVACIAIAGAAMVVMTLVVPYGVFTRYVLNSASSWPEPAGVLMMVVFTFLGGAGCYRANVHIAVSIFVDLLPEPARTTCEWIVIFLLALLSGLIVWWGISLVEATWHQVMAEFTWLRVGIAYMPIPISGALTLLFLLEQAWLGQPSGGSLMHREPVTSD